MKLSQQLFVTLKEEPADAEVRSHALMARAGFLYKLAAGQYVYGPLLLRVLRKIDPGAPHASVLVLDATTGQNAHNQVEVFQQAIDVSGLVITKLDGTARGGVAVALAERFGLPIYAVGVGEGIDDLRPFDATAFARALLGLDAGEGDAEG